jgi:hypothetical protein
MDSAFTARFHRELNELLTETQARGYVHTDDAVTPVYLEALVEEAAGCGYRKFGEPRGCGYVEVWPGARHCPKTRALTNELKRLVRRAGVERFKRWSPDSYMLQRYLPVCPGLDVHRDNRDALVLVTALSLVEEASVFIHDKGDFTKVVDQWRAKPGSMMLMWAPSPEDLEMEWGDLRPPHSLTGGLGGSTRYALGIRQMR